MLSKLKPKLRTAARILAALFVVMLISAPWLYDQADAISIFRVYSCGTHTFSVTPDGHNGLARATTEYNTPGSGKYLTFVNATMSWYNWTSAANGISPASGELHDTAFVDPTTYLVREWALDTGPGYVTVGLTGMVAGSFNGTPLACGIIPSVAWVDVPGTTGGVTFPPNQLSYPLTADLDNDNVTDNSHCGTSCDKKKNQITEQTLYDRNKKACGNLDQALHRPHPFKDCKQSAQRSVYDNNGEKFADEWYDANKNGWSGPTDPSNAPDGWSGMYYPQKGVNHPNLTPTPTAIVTIVPRPTVSYANCSHANGLIVCDTNDNGTVHAQAELAAAPEAEATPTAAPTQTLVPTATPITTTLTHNKASGVDPGSTVVVSWSGVVGATSLDKFELWSEDEHELASPAVWKYTDSCTTTHGSNSVASGNCTVTIPSNIDHGHYFWVLYDGEGFITKASADLWIEDNCVRNPNNCSE